MRETCETNASRDAREKKDCRTPALTCTGTCKKLHKHKCKMLSVFGGMQRHADEMAWISPPNFGSCGCFLQGGLWALAQARSGLWVTRVGVRLIQISWCSAVTFPDWVLAGNVRDQLSWIKSLVLDPSMLCLSPRWTWYWHQQTVYLTMRVALVESRGPTAKTQTWHVRNTFGTHLICFGLLWQYLAISGLFMIFYDYLLCPIFFEPPLIAPFFLHATWQQNHVNRVV